jgi:IclR family pca regulon transcriptional regulator
MEMERRDYIASVEHCLQVIEAFDQEHPQLTVAEAAARTGLTRASARRYLLTLTYLGYAESDGRKFSLALRVLRLGYGHLCTAPLTRKAQPILEAAGRETDEITSIAVLDRTDVVFLARSETRRIISARIGVGTRLPAYCTSAGRVLLGRRTNAELRALITAMPRTQFTATTMTDVDTIIDSIAQARQDGYSLSDEEFEIGLRSIAVAVPDTQGRVTVAITASVQSARMSVDDMQRNLLPVLQRSAAELSRLL